MWDSPDVLKRRVPRVLVTGFLVALAVSGLAGCRNSPNVAAYVGRRAGDASRNWTPRSNQRLQDKQIAAYAKGKEDDFTRRVLTLLVQEEVYAAAADHFGVQVGDDAVRARITELLGTDDPGTTSTASSPSRASAARTSSRTCASSWSGRRSPPPRARPAAWPTPRCGRRYAQVKQGAGADLQFGYITVPDEATAATPCSPS